MEGVERQGVEAVAAGAGLAVEALALAKRIDDRTILEDIDLRIERGCFVALLGANGAGKSTLLKVLATLTPTSSGQLRLFGREVGHDGGDLRGRIGLIGHQSMLYRDLSARENLEFFARLYGVADPKGRAQILLNALGLAERSEDPVKAFSRGMTQRLAIARALVHKPDLLLADEPFDGLDAPSAKGLEGLLRQVHAAGKTIILTNHDIEQSLRLAQRAVVLRQGRVAIDRPTSELEAAGVLGEMERP